MTDIVHFRPATFSFLRDLAANNDRGWFAANKDRYETHVKEPGIEFISDFGSRLEKISSHYVADTRGVGGSLFRIHRDTRFAKDKTPYKTNTGMQFRHEAAKDVHAPGYYLHLEPGGCFAGVGMWQPDTASLTKIRDAIVADPAAWKRAAYGKRFSDVFTLSDGERLKRPPRGYDPEHPYTDDLRRKDFTAGAKLTQKQVTSPGFVREYARMCTAATPYMKFLCDALGLPF
jgi:uncharacterized protein (TIGR02453 family)